MTLEHHHHVPAGVGRRCRRAQLTDIAALVRLYEEQRKRSFEPTLLTAA